MSEIDPLRPYRLRIIRDRNEQVRSPAVTWLLSEVDRLEKELVERVTPLRIALRQIHDLADASEPSSVQAGQIARQAIDADDEAVNEWQTSRSR